MELWYQGIFLNEMELKSKKITTFALINHNINRYDYWIYHGGL